MSNNTHSRVAAFFAHHVDTGRLSQREIASTVGYSRANVISMFKTGVTRIPIEKIPALSKCMNVDPKAFLRLAMQEYMPETWETIVSILGNGLDVTECEYQMLQKIRRESGGPVCVKTPEQKAALDVLISSLSGNTPSTDILPTKQAVSQG